MGYQWNENFYNKIVNDVKEVVINYCVKLIYETMQDMVYSTVYNTYTPTQYKRRYSKGGGLGDIGTYDFEISSLNKNGFTLRVFSNAEGNSNAPNPNLAGKSIDECIVEGTGYSWKTSNIYKNQAYTRDFYKATLDSLIDSGILYNILKTKLKDKGINVK